MTTRDDPAERLRLAGHAFWTACGEAKVDLTALLLWFADIYTGLVLDQSGSYGADTARDHAAGIVTYRLIIDEAKGVITLIAAPTDAGRERTIFEIERRSTVPEAVRRAFEKDDKADG